jgi:hypothetical protein
MNEIKQRKWLTPKSAIYLGIAGAVVAVVLILVTGFFGCTLDAGGKTYTCGVRVEK